jgi:hypothetical protein
MNTRTLQDLFAKIDALLDGIDRQEDDPRVGWWRTSDGALIGRIKLRELKELLATELEELEVVPPSGYAFRYPDGIRFNNGREVNGCYPSEAIPYWFSQPPAPDPPPPAE